MPATQIVLGEQTRAALIKGIATLADAVRVTLGPKAREPEPGAMEGD